jgi:hypothetical protein
MAKLRKARKGEHEGVRQRPRPGHGMQIAQADQPAATA